MEIDDKRRETKKEKRREAEKSPFKKREIVKKVLLTAGKGVAIGTLIVFPPLAMPLKVILETIEERRWEVRNRQVKRTLKLLEKEKIVALREKDGELWMTFRKRGKELLLKYKIDELKIEKQKKWDGKWRVVIFDIPKKKRLARDVLRDKLKELEFYQLQRSVFVYPYECQREIELIKKVYEVEPYVYYLRVDFIGREAKLRRHFNL